MKLADTLSERGTTHGDFTDNSRVSQQLKAIIFSDPTIILSPVQCEALDMICHKLARIVCGNPNHSDHWHDIAGYAKLVEDRLEGANVALNKVISDTTNHFPTPPNVSINAKKHKKDRYIVVGE